ncbi:MAG: hypothetical protein ACRYFX_18510 [Janthinobacterium lividum]
MTPAQMFQQLYEALPEYQRTIKEAHRLTIHIRSSIDGEDYRIEQTFAGGIYLWGECETWEEVLAEFIKSQQPPF